MDAMSIIIISFLCGAIFGAFVGWTAKPRSRDNIVHMSPSFVTYKHLCNALRMRVAILEAEEKLSALTMNSQAAQLNTFRTEMAQIRYHVKNLTVEEMT